VEERDGVAYVLNDEILTVGIISVNCSLLRGLKIERRFVCVLKTYIERKCVPPPIILGDLKENSYLKKGMHFSLPIDNLFECENISGNKVVLRQYENFRIKQDKPFCL